MSRKSDVVMHEAEPAPDPKMFEEWIAYPDKRAYVPLQEHNHYASLRGWWTSGWQGDAKEVKRLTRLRPVYAKPVEITDDAAGAITALQVSTDE